MQNHKTRPAKRSVPTMSQKALREHLSENGRQSFCAEGICYSKSDWDRVEQKFLKKKRFNFNA